MLTLPHTLDHAVQELAMVRARHQDLALRHGSPVLRHLRTRPLGHTTAAIAIVSPDI